MENVTNRNEDLGRVEPKHSIFFDACRENSSASVTDIARYAGVFKSPINNPAIKAEDKSCRRMASFRWQCNGRGRWVDCHPACDVEYPLHFSDSCPTCDKITMTSWRF